MYIYIFLFRTPSKHRLGTWIYIYIYIYIPNRASRPPWGVSNAEMSVSLHFLIFKLGTRTPFTTFCLLGVWLFKNKNKDRWRMVAIFNKKGGNLIYFWSPNRTPIPLGVSGGSPCASWASVGGSLGTPWGHSGFPWVFFGSLGLPLVSLWVSPGLHLRVFGSIWAWMRLLWDSGERKSFRWPHFLPRRRFTDAKESKRCTRGSSYIVYSCEALQSLPILR